MRKSSLKRKTPLRRKKELKRYAKIKPVSDKRRIQNAVYARVKNAYLAAHPICEVCLKAGSGPFSQSSDLHHRHGRAGEMLFDTRYFTAVCRDHHNWIHANSNRARELGWLAGPVEFGRSQK